MNAPSHVLKPNLDDAQAFLSALEPSGYVTFRPWPETGSGATEKSAVHGTLSDKSKYLAALNAQKLAIGVTVNKTDGKGARSNNIKSVRALFAEYDAAQRENIPEHWPLEPHIVCESSPGNRHVYWLVEDCPLEAFTRFQKAIAATLGSDPSITDLPRIMRVPGFWHQKASNPQPFQSRLLEVNDLPQYSLIEVIDGLNLQPELEKLDTPANTTETMPTNSKGGDVGENYRHNFIKNEARTYKGDGLTGEKLVETVNAINQTRCSPPLPDAEVKKLIDWTDDKITFDQYTPAAATKQERPPLLLSDWTAERFRGEPPPVKWLVHGVIPAGVPGLLAAHGGVGKSYLCLDLAIKIATHQQAQLDSPFNIVRAFGGTLKRAGTAVFITSEDNAVAVHQRVHHIDPEGRYDAKRLIIIPLPDAGGTLTIVKENREGITLTPEYLAIREQLAAIDDLVMVAFDPLQSFVQADINADPKAPQFLMSELSALAAETGANVIVTHHMRKDGAVPVTDPESAKNAIRGSSALTDGGRFAYALWRMSEQNARTICNNLGKPYTRDCLIKGAEVKANGASTKAEHTYYRDAGGLLTDVTADVVTAVAEDTDALAELLEPELIRLFKDGDPMTITGENSIFRRKHELPKAFHEVKRETFEAIAGRLVSNGRLRKMQHPITKRGKLAFLGVDTEGFETVEPDDSDTKSTAKKAKPKKVQRKPKAKAKPKPTTKRASSKKGAK